MEQGDPNTPDITIRLLPQQQIPASAVNCYGLAGKVVISDTAWLELEPFRIGLSGEWEGDDLPELQEFGPPTGEANRSVEGWVAEKDRLVSCRDVENGCRVAVSNIGEFFVSTTGDQITAISIDATASAAEIMMALLGPPMILAFAALDIWLMHAGAVEQGGGAWLFSGCSGAGKSTLARELPQRGFSGKRLGDDMVAICAQDGGLWCLPAFPQLKLQPAQQLTRWEQRVRLLGICLLETPAEDSPESSFSLQQFAPAQVIHRLAGNTMGISLLDAETRRRHLRFVAALVDSIRLWRVIYPHQQQSIQLLGEALASQ